jgi:hypothetical protein
MAVGGGNRVGNINRSQVAESERSDAQESACYVSLAVKYHLDVEAVIFYLLPADPSGRTGCSNIALQGR